MGVNLQVIIIAHLSGGHFKANPYIKKISHLLNS